MNFSFIYACTMPNRCFFFELLSPIFIGDFIFSIFFNFYTLPYNRIGFKFIIITNCNFIIIKNIQNSNWNHIFPFIFFIKSMRNVFDFIIDNIN